MVLYNSLITTKNNSVIPVLKSGKTLESRYNPQQDAERKIQNQQINSKIVLILGVGSGILVEQLAENNPDTFFLALESSKEDISLLKQNKTFSNLYSLKNVLVFSYEDLESVLINNYIPAFYGNLQIIEQKAWLDENSDFTNQLKNKINKTLKTIAADFSVQAHFGKIWQGNIYRNLYNLNAYKNNFSLSPDISKTAVIVAAGPSLDKTIDLLKQSKNYFVISTDTAYQALLKNKIIPDIVVSIDGQNVSYNHFINIPENSKTLFVFDTCGNSSAVEKLLKRNEKVYLINSNHPFVNYINLKNYIFPNLFAGTGTVTIAALDLAIQCGFEHIEIFGADFSYINGKAYTKGTYLEHLYEKTSNHLTSQENFYNKLQFRTELIKVSDNVFTTEILESYRISLEDFLNKYDIKMNKNNFIYSITSNQLNNKITFNSQNINFEDFIETFKQDFNKINFEKDIGKTLLQNNCILSLLPYMAFLRTQEENSNYNVEKVAKLAYTNIVRYN